MFFFGVAFVPQEWYKHYRAKLWEGLCHQEHEMLDCPAAVLVVVSSTEVCKRERAGEVDRVASKRLEHNRDTLV